MKKTKVFLTIFVALLLIVAVFFFQNRDKIIYAFQNRDRIVYVGSVDYVEVDCNEKSEILSEVYRSDQRIRRENNLIKNAKEDHRNQELVISIIEECGMPTLNEVTQQQMNAIWLGLQHNAENKYRIKYFPLIEKAVENGDLNKEQYALMKDRMLMDDGQPQIFGTQIKNGKLYDLAAPETVNERRQEMGLEPIEDYLKSYGISYDAN